MDSVSLAPILTPHGRLLLAEENGAPLLDPDLARRLRDAFLRGPGHGLLQLGAGEVGTALPSAFCWGRRAGACAVPAFGPGAEGGPGPGAGLVSPPPDREREGLALGAPVMTGAESRRAAVLHVLWQETGGERCGRRVFRPRH